MPTGYRIVAFVFIVGLTGHPAEAKPLDETAFEREVLPSLSRDIEGDFIAAQDAYFSLMALGPAAHSVAPALLNRLKRKNDPMRGSVVDALARVGPTPDALATLLGILQTEPDESDAAFYALAQLGEASQPAVPAMLKALNRNHFGLRSDYYVSKAMALRGPIARAAFPRYLEMIKSTDPYHAAFGASRALDIRPGDPVVLALTLKESGRGSLPRKCRLAAVVRENHIVVPVALVSEKSCRPILKDDLRAAPAKERPPHRSLALSLRTPRTRYFSGESIEVTPEVAPDLKSGRAPAGPLFHERWGGLAPALCVTVLSSTGAPLGRLGPFGGSAFSNMMGNGLYSPPASCTGIGSRATIMIARPGRYLLAVPDFRAHIGFSSGPIVAVKTQPVAVEIAPPTESYLRETLADCEKGLGDREAMTRGRAAERLRHIPDPRAVELLVRALDDQWKNVLGPAVLGLLEYQEPAVVASALRRAIADGHPSSPDTMRWYGEILARTDHGWPDDTPAGQESAESEGERWRLLLLDRQKRAFSLKKLSPSEIVKAVKNGFLGDRFACDSAFREILRSSSGSESMGGDLGVIGRCGTKEYSPQLWKVARDAKRFEWPARMSALQALQSFDDPAWLKFVLDDLGSSQPSMPPDMNLAYQAAMEADPVGAARIMDSHFASGVPARQSFAARALFSMTLNASSQPVNVPIDAFKAIRAVAAAPEVDLQTSRQLGLYLSLREPKAALLLVEDALVRGKRAGKPVDPEVLQILPVLPDTLALSQIKRLLTESAHAVPMAEGFEKAVGNPQTGVKPTSHQYFTALVDYFEASTTVEGRLHAAKALRDWSGIPEGPIDAEAATETARRNLSRRWRKWARQSPR